MSTQPNNNTLYVQSVTGGRLTGGSLTKQTQKGAKLTLNARAQYAAGLAINEDQ
jgi:hypothetical protein